MVDSLVEDCDFSGTDLSNMTLSERDPSRRTVYRRCRFAGTRFVPDRLGRARFEDCVFADIVVRALERFRRVRSSATTCSTATTRPGARTTGP